jgi:hypothetical protein
MRKSSQAAMQRVSARDSNKQRREHSHPELERRIVSITDHSQKEEDSPPELEREIVGIRITTKGNSQNTHILNYSKRLLTSATNNSQKRALTS